jgi:hypothetical protein
MANVILDDVTINQPVANTTELNNIPTNNLQVGVVVFQSDISTFFYWDGTSWENLSYLTTSDGTSTQYSIPVFSDTQGNTLTSTDLIVDSDKITQLAEPENPQDAATKNYVDTTTGDVLANGTLTSDHLIIGDGDTTITSSAITVSSDSQIKSVGDPTGLQDAVTKNYLDNAINQPVANANELNNIPTDNLQVGAVVFQSDISTFFYWDGTSWENLSYLTTSDGTSTQYSIPIFSDTQGNTLTSTDLIVDSDKITQLAEPENPQDAATKNYVDTTTGDVLANGTLTSDHLIIGDGDTTITSSSITVSTDSQIKSVGDPTDLQDVATKNYVDNKSPGSGDVSSSISSSTNRALTIFDGTTGKLIKEIDVTGNANQLTNLDYAQESSSAISLEYLSQNYSLSNQNEYFFSVRAEDPVAGRDVFIYSDDYISLYYTNTSNHQFFLKVPSTNVVYNISSHSTWGRNSNNILTSSYSYYFPSITNVNYYLGATPNTSPDSSIQMNVNGAIFNSSLILLTAGGTFCYELKDVSTVLRKVSEIVDTLYVTGKIKVTAYPFFNYLTFVGAASGTISSNSYPFSWGGGTVNSSNTGFPIPSTGSSTHVKLNGYAARRMNITNTPTDNILNCQLEINGTALSDAPIISFPSGNSLIQVGSIDTFITSGNILNIKALNDVSGSNGYILSIFGSVYYNNIQ